MINQISPALNNIRTYSGKNKKLIQQLLNNVVKYRNELYQDFLKSRNLNLLKKVIIAISPKQYLRIIQLFDQIKTVFN